MSFSEIDSATDLRDAPAPPPIQAIPCNYKGVRFRSRLEAKWAAWFDIAGWQWDYESIDLFGWTPDFLIQGYRGPIYAEVKPVWCGTPTDQYRKAKRSQVRHSADVLLLGLSPALMRGSYAIGVCNEADDGDAWDLALGKHGCPGIRLGYCSASGWFGDRITGTSDSRSGGSCSDAAMRMWAEAGNAVQWSPK